jgi:hypothetical protein
MSGESDRVLDIKDSFHFVQSWAAWVRIAVFAFQELQMNTQILQAMVGLSFCLVACNSQYIRSPLPSPTLVRPGENTSVVPTPTVEITSPASPLRPTPTFQPSSTPTPVPCPVSAVPTDYVGCQSPPLPKGLVATNGWLFSDYQTSRQVYGFEVISDTLRMLWLEKLLGNGTLGESNRWEVKAVLILPQISESETFAHECRINGAAEIDAEIFAVAEVKDSIYLDNIKQAWRANRKTSAFEIIPTTGIVCFLSPLEYWR